MNLSKLVIIVLSIFVFSFADAQHFSLSGKVLNSKSDVLVISKYNFNNKNYIDSLKIIDNKIFYKLDNFEKGMYNIKNDYMSVDFIFNKENIEIEYDCGKKEDVIINNSIENKILNDFFSFYETNNLSFTLLSQLQKYYPQEDDFYDDIIDKINQLNQDNFDYIDSIKQNYPETMVSRILQLYTPNKTSFLDTNISYSNDLSKTVFLGDLIISFINNYQNKNYSKEQQEKAFMPAIDIIFETFDDNPTLSINVAEYLIDKFRYFEFDEISEYISIKATKFGKDKCLNNAVLRNKYNKITALANVRTGSVAPNFLIRKKIMLHDIKAKNKLVIFWTSWCPHCEEFIDELIEKNKDLSSDIKIITYSLDFEDASWKEVAKKFPPTWINRCMCEDDTEAIPDAYAVYGTPAIFLLNEKNIIIDKPKSIDEIDFLFY